MKNVHQGGAATACGYRCAAGASGDSGAAARDIEKLAVYSKLLDEHQCEMDGESSYWRRVGDIYDETSNAMAMVPLGPSWSVRATMDCAHRIFYPGDFVGIDCFFREVSSA